MADLQTFDDGTIQRARERFTDGKRGSGDDPIATHAKVAQDVMLGHLEALIARAEAKAGDTHAGLQGELDGDSLIDPFVSYGENKAAIQTEYGVQFAGEARAERADQVASADEKAKRHARETLRENFEAIEAGEKSQLVQDIAEEFGQGFVADVLGRERELANQDPTASAPEARTPGETPERELEVEVGDMGAEKTPTASASETPTASAAASEDTSADQAASASDSATASATAESGEQTLAEFGASTDEASAPTVTVDATGRSRLAPAPTSDAGLLRTLALLTVVPVAMAFMAAKTAVAAFVVVFREMWRDSPPVARILTLALQDVAAADGGSE